MTALTDQLNAIGEQLSKATSEILTEIQNLENALAAQADTVSPEAQAALDALKAKAQALDDIVPDAPAA